jgi:hypothetical protein
MERNNQAIKAPVTEPDGNDYHGIDLRTEADHQKELESFLTAHAHLDGARLLSFLIRWRGHKFHCCRLSHLVFPPDAERLELLAEQASLSGHQPRDRESKGETYLLQDLANPQLIRAREPDAWDLAGLTVSRHYDNPLTDRKTLSDIAKRIRKLKETLRQGVDTMQARAELEQLYRYRSFCLAPGNRIKHANPEFTKAYQGLFQALRRLLNKLSDDQAPLLDYIKGHLTTGSEFGWD